MGQERVSEWGERVMEREMERGVNEWGERSQWGERGDWGEREG